MQGRTYGGNLVRSCRTVLRHLIVFHADMDRLPPYPDRSIKMFLVYRFRTSGVVDITRGTTYRRCRHFDSLAVQQQQYQVSPPAAVQFRSVRDAANPKLPLALNTFTPTCVILELEDAFGIAVLSEPGQHSLRQLGFELLFQGGWSTLVGWVVAVLQPPVRGQLLGLTSKAGLDGVLHPVMCELMVYQRLRLRTFDHPEQGHRSKHDGQESEGTGACCGSHALVKVMTHGCCLFSSSAARHSLQSGVHFSGQGLRPGEREELPGVCGYSGDNGSTRHRRHLLSSSRGGDDPSRNFERLPPGTILPVSAECLSSGESFFLSKVSASHPKCAHRPVS